MNAGWERGRGSFSFRPMIYTGAGHPRKGTEQ